MINVCHILIFRGKAYVIRTLLSCDWSVQQTASKPQKQYRKEGCSVVSSRFFGGSFAWTLKKRLRRRLGIMGSLSFVQQSLFSLRHRRLKKRVVKGPRWLILNLSYTAGVLKGNSRRNWWSYYEPILKTASFNIHFETFELTSLQLKEYAWESSVIFQ